MGLSGEELNAGFETVDVLAQSIHAFQQLVGFGTRHQMLALVREVFRHVLNLSGSGMARPAEETPREPAEVVSGHIANHFGNFFFDIRAQEHRKLAEALSELYITADL